MTDSPTHDLVPTSQPSAPTLPTQQTVVVNVGTSTLPAAVDGPRGGRQFAFDGGAATYFGTAILALALTAVTLGICYPFALVLRERWRAKHSYINGHQLVFNGSAIGLFGNWIKWFLLCVVTIGIYSFWVGPRIARWKWEHTGFAAPIIAVRQG